MQEQPRVFQPDMEPEAQTLLLCVGEAWGAVGAGGDRSPVAPER